ncbi:pro-neuregulin-2, membrane-bound isoform-like isoform X3 [Zophobas morio]|uniref:pro-neuregulin-2, membrane-bound isoform-like isoform X3 n=1 Tax=Zophobas morio TaxID=2755281 RepID=UPI003083595D
MCTISYRRCACFVFLVVLVVSCSGFRADSLEMTDVSRRNSPEGAHRLRHRRQAVAPRRRLHCPELDASWKAYRADAVAVASVDSRSFKCKGNCPVQFKIHQWLKNHPPYDDELIRLTFRTERGAVCDSDDAETTTPYFPVKSIELSKKYILFLRTDGPHSYRAAYAPEISKNKTIKTVRRVSDAHFRPKPLRLEIVPRNESRKRLRLICRVRGFPIPLITWKVNDTILLPNNRTRITQKKRKSTLVIRNLTEADYGRYRCVARSVDKKSSHVDRTIGPKTMSKPKVTTTTNRPKPGINSTVSDSDRKPCDFPMNRDFCLNGGTCFFTQSMVEYSCVPTASWAKNVKQKRPINLYTEKKIRIWSKSQKAGLRTKRTTPYQRNLH